MSARKPLIVMTGGTSGVGKRAIARLVPRARGVILGTRNSPGPAGARSIALELADLESCRRFADRVVADADGAIDVVVLNAGGGFSGGTSAQGFELNFAVNHLAHYLILRLLMPHLSPDATIVLTTSGTHDPDKKTMARPPIHADANRLAWPAIDPQLDPSPKDAASRAYSASKLCNLLTAQALATSQEARRGSWRVIAFSPGPTPGTGLMRDRGPLLRFAWKRLGGVLKLVMPQLNSIDKAGEALAALALGERSPPAGQVYALLDHDTLDYPQPSRLARDRAVAMAMWRDSAVLCGLDGPVPDGPGRRE